MKSVDPYLNFAGNTEEAFTFYRSALGGEFMGEVMRYRDFEGNPMNVPEADLDKVAHMALRLDTGTLLMGTDILESFGQKLVAGNNFYITIQPESREETERLFTALSEGGTVEMPLEKTSWAELYGSCADRFGIQWMLVYDG